MNELDEYEADAHLQVDKTDTLTKISILVDALVEAKKRVEEAEVELKQRQAAVSLLAEKEIPELMRSVRQKYLTTTSGIIVELEEKLRASIPKDREAECFAWLRKNGHGGVIKNEVRVLLDRGQDNVKGALLDECRKLNLETETKTSVHPQTLVALLNELIKQGVDVPLELFGGFQQSFVKISQPKLKVKRIG